MPLNHGRSCKTKACKRKAIAANIRELKNANKGKGKKRSHEQIVAIALRSVFGSRKK